MLRTGLIRFTLASGLLASGLALASCDQAADELPPASLPATSPAASSPISSAASLPPPSTGAAVLTPKQKEQEQTLAARYKQHAITVLGLVPASANSPSIVRVKQMEAPGLDTEPVYRDIFYQTYHLLEGQPFQIKDESGAVIAEADTVRPKEFQLAKINGLTGFFQKESSRHYSYIAPVSSPEPNALLKGFVKGNWGPEAAAAMLGVPDSYSNHYDIFFKQGVEVEQRQRVFSLLFRKRYAEPVIGSIGTSSKQEEIEAALGKPPFQDQGQDPVFGYKLESYYIFFAGAAAPYDIAVYPGSGWKGTEGGAAPGSGSNHDLAALLRSRAQAGGLEAMGTMDEMKLRWPDYDRLDNARGSYILSYVSSGIEADINYEEQAEPYIQVYGNYEGPLTESIRLPEDAAALAALPEPPYPYLLRLHQDLVFLQEQRRLAGERYIRERAAHSQAVSPDGAKIVIPNDNTSYDSRSFYVLHPAGEEPDREIHVGNFSSSFTWLNNRYLIFVESMYGITGYDTKLNKEFDVDVDTTPADLYKLEQVKDGKITYTKDNIKRELSYSFKANGDLVLN
ncbi:MAG: hypothetical protein K0R57_4923 [Paenibacillaceae bacterium]|jgi:hypothetical protein|nr:hypothetical protein [Paenibacillaceae bacterium]